MTNNSTQNKLTFLNRLFKLYNEDPTDLLFYLRDESENNIDDDDKYNLLRRRYWAYALSIIEEKNEENGTFSNVNPSKDSWLSGSFGIGGFTICCVVNYLGVRVEVLFGKKNKQENKNAFDNLYKHKNEIESTLGTTLQWKSDDDNKTSKVFIELKNVSIGNETDWLQMANFQASWVKRFYDVIIPYIK